jgi:hypothetical protein
MPKKFEFNIKLLKGEDMNTAYFIVPFNVQKEYGKKGLVKVKASFDGAEYRGSLMPNGDGTHCFGITQALRKKIGKHPGDMVHVIIEEDTNERVVELPVELEALFRKNKKAKECFDTLSYTNRKEYAQWIAGAKKEETKLSRLERTEEMLLKGIKHP